VMHWGLKRCVLLGYGWDEETKDGEAASSIRKGGGGEGEGDLWHYGERGLWEDFVTPKRGEKKGGGQAESLVGGEELTPLRG